MSKPYRPLVCPALEKCEDDVDEGFAEHICYGYWESCKHNKHFIARKKPREWAIDE